MSDHTFTQVRRAFADAAASFAVTVDGIGDERWATPGLGEWTVLDLVGHTSRALLTVEQYRRSGRKGPERDTIEYYRAVRSSLGDPAAVAERGREAGRALGADVAESVRALVTRVTELVDSSDADTLLETPVGAWRLADYLPTRVFELAVHTADLRRSLGGAFDIEPASVAHEALRVLGALVADAEPDEAGELLAALTGRGLLSAGYSILG